MLATGRFGVFAWIGRLGVRIGKPLIGLQPGRAAIPSGPDHPEPATIAQDPANLWNGPLVVHPVPRR
ncbi:MAG TPA: hypothetical protein VEV61_17900 [Streptosporangiaceae bacterium]|nr:hypothetical protein [Streptosporangiaceae bacterium]